MAAAEALAGRTWPDAQHAVVAVPDDRKGERLVLATTQPGADAKQLLAEARTAGAAEIAVPRTLLHVDAMPLLDDGQGGLPRGAAPGPGRNGGHSTERSMMRGGDTRVRIKQQAMQLFAARGIDGVSVRDIADAVGMKPSNLYAHFRSREDLVEELFAEGYAAYGATLAEALGGVPAAAGFAQRLGIMVAVICRLHDTDTTRFRFLLLSQHASLPNLPAGNTPIDLVQLAVTQAMATGQLPARDPALATAMIVGVVLQTATFHLYGRITQALTEMQDSLTAACLAAVSLPT